MKKILSIVCILLTIPFFAACGSSSDKNISSDDTSKQEQSTSDEQITKDEQNDTISDDLYSFEVLLNGQKYKLPASYSEFEKNGWSLQGDSNLKVAPNQYTLSQTMKNGNTTVYVSMINNEKNELSLNECKVGSIKVDTFDVKDSKTVLTLPKGINFNSSKEDIIKAYGEPTNNSELESQIYMTYEVSSYESVKFSINKEENKLSGIEVKNFMENTGSTSQNQSNNETPEAVKNYSAPTELSNDLLSFNAKYDGVLYNMPAPVAEFVKNGWSIQKAPKDGIAARTFKTGIVLRKGNQTLNTAVFNNSDKETNVENCFITEIIADENMTNVPIELPKGIKLGSTKEDIEATYSGMDVKKSESSTYEYFSYRKKSQQEINILVNKETGKVSKISVQYVPSKQDYK